MIILEKQLTLKHSLNRTLDISKPRYFERYFMRQRFELDQLFV